MIKISADNVDNNNNNRKTEGRKERDSSSKTSQTACGQILSISALPPHIGGRGEMKGGRGSVLRTLANLFSNFA